MRIAKLKYALLSAIALGALISHPALAGENAADIQPAEQAPAAENTNSSDIVVTARRVEERLQDVPISITVFSQQQITDRNVVNAGDLAKYTPSLSVNTRYGAESTSFAIRGFTQEQNTAASVAVYFADVVAPRGQGTVTNAGNGAGAGYFFDLQNVQVLKGPQGTLFGRNTTGGAVLLVPQKPTDKFEGYVEGSVGNYDMVRLQAVLNLPIADNFRVRLGMDRQKRDGYLNNISGIGPKDFADINYQTYRLSVMANLSANLENYTIASYTLSDTNGFYPKVLFQDNIARDPFPALRAAQIAATAAHYYDIENGNPAAFQRISQRQVINTTSWQVFKNLTVKNILSYGEVRQASSANIYGENGYQNGTTLPYFGQSVTAVPGTHNLAQATFTEELRLQGSSADGRLTYQGGVYYEKATPIGHLSQETYGAGGLACADVGALRCADVTGRGSITFARTEYRFRDIGVYAQATYDITDTISLTGGIRYTSDKSNGLGESLRLFFPAGTTVSGPSAYGCVQPSTAVTGGTSAQIQADPTRCDLRRQVSSSKPTWLIDLDWKPNRDILAYAKYARGYRQGGLNVSSFGLETWNPEKVDLYEVGAKTSFRGAVHGNFNVAAFYNDFTNQQVAINLVSCQVVPTAPNCAGVTVYPASAQGIGNGGKSSIKGVEVDASISPFKGLRLDGSYAYLDTKLKSITLPTAPAGFFQLLPAAVVGGPLALTPKNKYSITASYTLPLNEALGQLSLSATFVHQDKQFGSTSSVAIHQTLPAEKQLNMNLNWNSVAGKPIDLSFFVTNLTKEKYYTWLTGASFGWDSAVLNEPRMFGVRVKVHFGD